MLIAIVACETGFWVLLALGLAARYGLRLRRVSTVLLLGVPSVDVALLAFTIADLRRGTPPSASHALAAVYLGFTVAFGHSLIRWADRKAARRYAGGPPPAPRPAPGTPARARKEWHDFGLAALGFATTALLIGLLAALTPARSGIAPLLSPLPGLGIALVVWFLGWPVWETVRASRAGTRPR